MRRLAVLFSFLLIGAFLFFLLRDFLLLFLLKEALLRSGLEFSCEKLSSGRGCLKFEGLVLKDASLDLKAARGSIDFSWKERGLKIHLEGFEARYSPSSVGSFSPPSYLAALSLKDGSLVWLGDPPLTFEVKRVALSGLKGFFRSLQPKEALARREETSVFPVPRRFHVGSPLSPAITLEGKVDLSRLPLWIKERVPLKDGFLGLEIGLEPVGEEKLLLGGEARLQKASLLIKDKSFPLEGEGKFSGAWERETGLFELRAQGVLNPPLSFSFCLKGTWRENESSLSNLTLDFEAPLERVSPFVGLKLRGVLFGALESDLSQKAFLLRLKLREGGFEINEERVGEGFSLTIDLKGKLREKLFFEGEANLGQGEVFWAPWYYALKDHVWMSFKGVLGEELVLENLLLRGPFEAEVQGLKVYPTPRRPQKARLSFAVEKFWRPLVAEPFGEEYAVLKEISPRGKLSFSQEGELLTFVFDGEVGFRGHLAEGFSLSAGYDSSGSCETFSFGWRRIEGSFVTAGPFRLEGEICPPEIILKPFKLSLFEGHLRGKGGLGSLEKRFLSLKEILLENLTPPFPDPFRALSPRIFGNFERLLIEPARFQGKGTLVVELAGGKVIFSDPFFELGILPRYGARVEFSGVDLAFLSRALGLGLITGRLRGRIEDLVMVGKLPESFELWLEDDPSYQGPKRISLKAVRQIAELGGGSATFFVPFVQKLRYSRLGIYCRLQNDIFFLRGLIKEGGREYLLKGPKLLGVDVINQNPGGAISFKEMVRRLKRILEEEDEKASQETLS